MKSIRKVAYTLTDKGMALLAPYQLTHDAIGIIEAARNQVPSPPEKSHVDMVNELIDEIEQNPPLSKGDKLAILMDCSDRIHNRWLEAYEAMHAIPENHVSRNAAFEKVKRLHRASTRVTRKIIALLEK